MDLAGHPVKTPAVRIHKVLAGMALYPIGDLQELEDAVVHLREDGEMNGKAGAPVLSSRTAGEPGKSVILLQNKPEHI